MSCAKTSEDILCPTWIVKNSNNHVNKKFMLFWRKGKKYTLMPKQKEKIKRERGTKFIGKSEKGKFHYNSIN